MSIKTNYSNQDEHNYNENGTVVSRQQKIEVTTERRRVKTTVVGGNTHVNSMEQHEHVVRKSSNGSNLPEFEKIEAIGPRRVSVSSAADQKLQLLLNKNSMSSQRSTRSSSREKFAKNANHDISVKPTGTVQQNYPVQQSSRQSSNAQSVQLDRSNVFQHSHRKKQQLSLNDNSGKDLSPTTYPIQHEPVTSDEVTPSNMRKGVGKIFNLSLENQNSAFDKMISLLSPRSAKLLQLSNPTMQFTEQEGEKRVLDKDASLFDSDFSHGESIFSFATQKPEETRFQKPKSSAPANPNELNGARAKFRVMQQNGPMFNRDNSTFSATSEPHEYENHDSRDDEDIIEEVSENDSDEHDEHDEEGEEYGSHHGHNYDNIHEGSKYHGQIPMESFDTDKNAVRSRNKKKDGPSMIIFNSVQSEPIKQAGELEFNSGNDYYEDDFGATNNVKITKDVKGGNRLYQQHSFKGKKQDTRQPTQQNSTPQKSSSIPRRFSASPSSPPSNHDSVTKTREGSESRNLSTPGSSAKKNIASSPAPRRSSHSGTTSMEKLQRALNTAQATVDYEENTAMFAHESVEIQKLVERHFTLTEQDIAPLLEYQPEFSSTCDACNERNEIIIKIQNSISIVFKEKQYFLQSVSRVESDHTEELKILKEKNAEAKIQIEALKEELKKKDKEKETAVNDTRALLVSRLESEMGRKDQEYTYLKEKIQMKEEEMKRAQQEQMNLQRELSDTKNRLSQSQNDNATRAAFDQFTQVELTRLQNDLQQTKKALESKNQEVSNVLNSFSEMQRQSEKRESEFKQSHEKIERTVSILEAEKKRLQEKIDEMNQNMSGSISEISSLKTALELARHDSLMKNQSEGEAQKKIQNLNEEVAVEKQLRQRAEAREREEKTERTAAYAQLLALKTQHQKEIEKVRQEMFNLVAQLEERVRELQLDKKKNDAYHRELTEDNLILEEENKTLRDAIAAQEKAVQELTEQLNAKIEQSAADKNMKRYSSADFVSVETFEDLGRKSGQIEVLKRRLTDAEQSTGNQILEKQKELDECMKKIQELEAEIEKGDENRRKMHNMIQELRGNVRVFARVRPFLPCDNIPDNEAISAIECGVDQESLCIYKYDDNFDADTSHNFQFDHVFGQSSDQETVFKEISEFVQSALDGFNVCLFSYGQTGSGKTHSMQGIGNGPMRGIIPRAMEQVGKYKTKLEKQGWEYFMEVSFLEIYNEQIKDLLRDDSNEDFKHEIKRDLNGKFFVTNLNLVEVDPNDVEQIEQVMSVAARHRSVGQTSMNAQSSRSHSVFSLYLTARNEQSGMVIKGQLSLCDLAGSERLDRTQAEGDRLTEAKNINKSLSCLADVFSAIGNKNSHIPFRNSKLTYLLQPALSGDGKTLMMVNLSPTNESYSESLSSLRFAAQVNQCELGKAKRQVSEIGGSEDNESGMPPSGVGAKRSFSQSPAPKRGNISASQSPPRNDSSGVRARSQPTRARK